MPDPIMLPEVVVTATKIDPKRHKKAMHRLYPKGEVSMEKVDSLRKAGFDKVIGKPIEGTNMYGPAASDAIKRLMNGRKKI